MYFIKITDKYGYEWESPYFYYKFMARFTAWIIRTFKKEKTELKEII